MKLPPEKRAARLLRGRLASLANEIAREAKARKVHLRAEFFWVKGGKNSVKINVWVTDAENERGPDDRVQPYGTRLVAGTAEVVRRKLKEL